MKNITCKEVKDNMSEILNEVAYAKENFKIFRHKKGIAMLISLDEWEFFEYLRKKEEDEEDVAEAKIALKDIRENGTISFEEMKKRVGL